MEATKQMNVRINTAKKSQGDARLASLGITPSQFIQGAYDFLCRFDTKDSDIRRIIEPPRPQKRDEALDHYRLLQQRIHEFNREHGAVAESHSQSTMNDNELLEQALWEKYMEEER